jgi:hypothetical protein
MFDGGTGIDFVTKLGLLLLRIGELGLALLLL